MKSTTKQNGNVGETLCSGVWLGVMVIFLMASYTADASLHPPYSKRLDDLGIHCRTSDNKSAFGKSDIVEGIPVDEPQNNIMLPLSFIQQCLLSMPRIHTKYEDPESSYASRCIYPILPGASLWILGQILMVIAHRKRLTYLFFMGAIIQCVGVFLLLVCFS